MPTLTFLIFALTVFAFVVFIIGAWAAFDVTVIEKRSRIFAICFLVSVFSTLAFQYRYPRPESTLSYVCFMVLFVAIIIFFCAVAANRKKKLTAVHSSDLPSHLTRSGPYRYVRHPFYLAYILTFFSSALASEHAVPTLCAAVAFANYLYAAYSEEAKFAKSALAGEYRAYQASTGMFLPRLRTKRQQY